MEGHLYRNGAKGREKRKFEKEYGKEKGDYVYGSVIGKVKREREAKKTADPPSRHERSDSVFDESFWLG